MVVDQKLVEWYQEFVRTSLIGLRKSFKENPDLGAPDISLFELYNGAMGARYAAGHVIYMAGNTKESEAKAALKYFGEHDCPIQEMGYEKRHLMRQLEDGQGVMAYDVLFPR